MRNNAPLKIIRAVLVALLCASVSSCAFLHRKKRTESKNGMPSTAAVVAVGNQSQDITMPVLIRYFLEEEMISKGFKLINRFNEVDSQLRQMGITDPSQINEGNFQNVGQSLKVDGLMQGTLLESSQNRGVKTIRASFRLISVLTGQAL